MLWLLIMSFFYQFYSKVNSFLEPADMFKGEIEEIIGNVKIADSLMTHFRHTFDKHKVKVPSMYAKDEEPRRWHFDSEMVFERFTKVHKRLKLAYVSIVFRTYYINMLNRNQTFPLGL